MLRQYCKASITAKTMVPYYIPTIAVIQIRWVALESEPYYLGSINAPNFFKLPYKDHVSGASEACAWLLSKL